MNKLLQQLFANKEIQKKVIKLLINEGLATSDSVHFSNMTLTKEGKNFIKTAIEVDETFIKEYRKIWPAEKNSTPATIRGCYIRYKAAHPDHSYDMILKAAKQWVQDKGAFCGEAHYFFEKTIAPGVKDVRCERYIELISKGIKNDNYDSTRLE